MRNFHTYSFANQTINNLNEIYGTNLSLVTVAGGYQLYDSFYDKDKEYTIKQIVDNFTYDVHTPIEIVILAYSYVTERKISCSTFQRKLK